MLGGMAVRKDRYKGILFIPIILILYMIIGTIEFRCENAVLTEPVDCAEEIEEIKAIQAESRAKLAEINEILEELQYDESIPLSHGLQLHLKAECKRYGVDVEEAVAIMITENPALDPELVHRNENGTVDTGLFQINDCHKNEFYSMGFDNLKDPKQNISYGVYFLSTLDKYEGHQKYMAYNMGEEGMKKLVNRGVASTAYSRKVMRKLEDKKP